MNGSCIQRHRAKTNTKSRPFFYTMQLEYNKYIQRQKQQSNLTRVGLHSDITKYFDPKLGRFLAAIIVHLDCDGSPLSVRPTMKRTAPLYCGFNVE